MARSFRYQFSYSRVASEHKEARPQLYRASLRRVDTPVRQPMIGESGVPLALSLSPLIGPRQE